MRDSGVMRCYEWQWCLRAGLCVLSVVIPGFFCSYFFSMLCLPTFFPLLSVAVQQDVLPPEECQESHPESWPQVVQMSSVYGHVLRYETASHPYITTHTHTEKHKLCNVFTCSDCDHRSTCMLAQCDNATTLEKYSTINTYSCPSE